MNIKNFFSGAWIFYQIFFYFQEHKFRIRAENAHGVSDPSEESEAVVTNEPKIDIDYDKMGE